MPRSERYIYISPNILVFIMNSKNILVLSLCVLFVLVIAGCAYKTISDSTTETVPDSVEKQQDEGCINHYLAKFGIGMDDITIENTYLNENINKYQIEISSISLPFGNFVLGELEIYCHIHCLATKAVYNWFMFITLQLPLSF